MPTTSSAAETYSASIKENHMSCTSHTVAPSFQEDPVPTIVARTSSATESSSSSVTIDEIPVILIRQSLAPSFQEDQDVNNAPSSVTETPSAIIDEHPASSYPKDTSDINIATRSTVAETSYSSATVTVLTGETMSISNDNTNNLNQIIPTSAITFIESEHGRLRRIQRGIDKKDLQRAMKYGVREIQYRTTKYGDSISKYTYNDIVYIVNDTTHKEITSYAKPFKLDLVTITEEQEKEHQHFTDRLKNDVECWTSHLVIVVDTSGSMNEADVWGARNRLQAVWLTIALDIIATRIESDEGGGTDAVSIITLAELPQVIIKEQPTTWILYNKIATIYNDVSVQPFGHGPYLKSLTSAREILERNTCASCAMHLTFLSDGRPSSERIRVSRRRVVPSIREQTERLILDEILHLAKTFGRRLTFQAIGIGDFDDFYTLEKMVDVAKDYGVTANLLIPSMSTSGLGNIFSTVGSSLTTTQMELTNCLTMKQERVKAIQRESRTEASKLIRVVDSAQFFIYPLTRFQRIVYEETKVELPIVEVFGSTTEESFQSKRWKTIKKYTIAPPQHTETKYIALAKEPFGEGAERFAFRFFEVGSDSKKILGNPMVAKESRYEKTRTCDESHDLSNKYIETQLETQQLSRRLAKEFNDTLNRLRRVDPKTPRVCFLDCSIYKIDESDGTSKNVLVENKLDHNKWTKWNTNSGYVEGIKEAEMNVGSYREIMKQVYKVKNNSSSDLNIIDEGDEDEDESEDEQVQGLDEIKQYLPIVFSPNEVAQAFSHFTYWASGRKRLVCDLQGVYDDDTKQLILSDPVIHYHNPNKVIRRYVHGRTDKGEEGVKMFFATHKHYCGHLCKLVLRGLRPTRSAKIHFDKT